MRITYEKELTSIQNWIKNINNELSRVNSITINHNLAKNIRQQIEIIADKITDEYPFYSIELKNISTMLFISQVPYQPICRLNNAVFGGLFVIIKHIAEEPSNMSIWQEIHPRIVKISKDLFSDRHYAAAERAVKEVESRLRELFQTLKPNATVPTKIGDVINALLSDNGLYQFADLSTTSGKNYRRGIQHLCEGIIAAYRNPSAHDNLSCTKREAIMLASQIMYVLDK